MFLNSMMYFCALTVKRLIFVSLLFTFSPLFCEIKDVFHFDDLLNHVDRKSLVILDIDNTLITTAQELGSDQWFYHQLHAYLEKGMTPKNALEQTLAEWEGIQNITKIVLVEKNIPEIINTLQKEKITILGMTTRGLGLATRTCHQLASLGIDLSKTAPLQDEVFLTLHGHGILFRQGILFTSGTHKGGALAKLLGNRPPKKIVFINDKRSNLLPVEEQCKFWDIPFIGLRYAYLDQKVATFRKEIADIQYNKFFNILSDEEAEKLLK